ncbi:NUDIX domain-containing protein [Aureimonas ureilytica]|uniref:NUDIX domain-containing protein n=1 Tax=Aureimonas ureilytica TaxID=401562 RepID=UPI000375EAF6|nr:NUDIX domain-containing protein [Aureimonas ureilytica]
MASEPRVGCGVAILREGRLLLVQRRGAPEAGSWSFPGGKVDPFEPTETAAARETAEELGIAVGPLALLCVVDLIDREADTHWVSPVYRADRFTGEPRIVEPHKHEALGWFALDALPAPLSKAVEVAAQVLGTDRD